MNRSGSVGVVGRRGVGLKPYILLAAASIFTLLMSCGDNIIEGGKSGPIGSDLKGTINVHVRNGAGNGAFTSAADSVYVTLIDAGTRPQLLGANGSVNFTNLTEGSYEIRVSKTGYATAYYTAKILQDEVTGGTGKVVNIPAVLYKLDASLTGTLLYEKKDGSSGYATGAEVRLEVGVNRTTEVKDFEDIKIENRIFTAPVGADGKYNFDSLPNVPGGEYSLTALGFTTGGIDFEDVVIYAYKGSSPSLKTGATTVVRTVTNTNVVTELSVIGWSPSLKGSEKLEIEFNATLVDLGKAISVVEVKDDQNRQIPQAVAYDGRKLVVTPDWAWNLKQAKTITFTVKNLRSSSGAVLALNGETPAVRAFTNEVPINITDAVEQFFAVTNFGSGTLVLADSSSDIPLIFNKEIDTARVGQNVYQDLLGTTNQAYKVTVAGSTITLKPTTGKWTGIGTSTGLKIEIRNLYSVDGDVITSSDVYAVLPSKKEKFVVASAVPAINTSDEIRIASDDDSIKITLKLSLPFGARTDGTKPVITVNGNQVEFDTAGVDAFTFGVRKGGTWNFGSNAVILKNFVAEDQRPLKNGTSTDEYTLNVIRFSSDQFYYNGLGQDAVWVISSDTTQAAPISLFFSDPLDETVDLKSALKILPEQPFTGSFTDGGKTVVLSAVPGVKWKTGFTEEVGGTPTTRSYLRISFLSTSTTPPVPILTGKGGGVLRNTNGAVDPIQISWSPVSSGPNKLAGVSVQTFEQDLNLSVVSAVPLAKNAATSGALQVYWKKVKDVDETNTNEGYEIFTYANGVLLDSAFYTGADFSNKNGDFYTGNSSGKKWAYLLPYGVAPAAPSASDWADSLFVASVSTTKLTSGWLDNEITLVIRPIAGGITANRLRGEPTSLTPVYARQVLTATAISYQIRQAAGGSSPNGNQGSGTPTEDVNKLVGQSSIIHPFDWGTNSGVVNPWFTSEHSQSTGTGTQSDELSVVVTFTLNTNSLGITPVVSTPAGPSLSRGSGSLSYTASVNAATVGGQTVYELRLSVLKPISYVGGTAPTIPSKSAIRVTLTGVDGLGNPLAFEFEDASQFWKDVDSKINVVLDLADNS